MSELAQREAEDIDTDLELLRFEGRARRGLVEVVHRKDLPSLDSECTRQIEKIFGTSIVLASSSSDYVVPWLGLTQEYWTAKDIYLAALAAHVKALRHGTLADMVRAHELECLAANNLAAAKRRAVAGIGVLRDYFIARGIMRDDTKSGI